MGVNRSIGQRVKYGLDYFLDHFLDHFFDHFLDHFKEGGEREAHHQYCGRGGMRSIGIEGGVGGRVLLLRKG